MLLRKPGQERNRQTSIVCLEVGSITHFMCVNFQLSLSCGKYFLRLDQNTPLGSRIVGLPPTTQITRIISLSCVDHMWLVLTQALESRRAGRSSSPPCGWKRAPPSTSRGSSPSNSCRATTLSLCCGKTFARPGKYELCIIDSSDIEQLFITQHTLINVLKLHCHSTGAKSFSKQIINVKFI